DGGAKVRAESLDRETPDDARRPCGGKRRDGRIYENSGRRQYERDPWCIAAGHRVRSGNSFDPRCDVRQSALYDDPARHAYSPYRHGVNTDHARRVEAVGVNERNLNWIVSE